MEWDLMCAVPLHTPPTFTLGNVTKDSTRSSQPLPMVCIPKFSPDATQHITPLKTRLTQHSCLGRKKALGWHSPSINNPHIEPHYVLTCMNHSQISGSSHTQHWPCTAPLITTCKPLQTDPETSPCRALSLNLPPAADWLSSRAAEPGHHCCCPCSPLWLVDLNSWLTLLLSQTCTLFL